MRCATLSQLHAYLFTQGTGILNEKEILRAAWVARVSALDLYVHELISQRMVQIFTDSLSQTQAFKLFKIPTTVVIQIRTASSAAEAAAAFDLEVRRQLSGISYQSPDRIAEGVRLISACSLWRDVAKQLGAPKGGLTVKAKEIKRTLSLIVDRRNKIVHEGDLQPSGTREPWPISSSDEQEVSLFIEKIVRAVDTVV